MTAIDLYCGAGGLSSGLIRAGIRVVLGVDEWRDALWVYEKNLGVPTLRWDLSVVPDLPPCEVLVAGPPCQDFSTGGHRVEGERAGQTMHFAAAVGRHMPRFFAMENVPLARKAQTYCRAKRMFRRHGYGLTEVVLDCSRYGVPQKRKRVLLVGQLGGEDDALRELLVAGASERPMTIREHCGDRLALSHLYRHYYGSAAGGGAKRCVWSVDETGPTITCENRRGKMPRHYKSRRGDSTTDLRGVRPLTVSESAMLQTFPDDWDWGLGRIRIADASQMVGNAVPPNLSEHLGRALLAAAAPGLATS